MLDPWPLLFLPLIEALTQYYPEKTRSTETKRPKHSIFSQTNDELVHIFSAIPTKHVPYIVRARRVHCDKIPSLWMVA